MDELMWNDLGPASDYALAVAYGYQGTEEDWVNENDLARTTAVNAKTDALQAKADAEAARDDAKEAADKAQECLDNIGDAEDNSEANAKLAQSYAVGGSGLEDRTDEDIDNAKYYAEQAKNEANRAQTIVGADVMQGATDTQDGVGGYVPAPLAGDNNRFLAGDGTYKEVNMDAKANGQGISFLVLNGRPHMIYEYEEEEGHEIVYENGQPVVMANKADIDNIVDNIFDGDTSNNASPDPMIDLIIGEIFDKK